MYEIINIFLGEKALRRISRIINILIVENIIE